jgi:hypothetical protein
MTYGQLTILAEAAVKAALEISSASEDAPAIRAVYQSVMDAGKPFIKSLGATDPDGVDANDCGPSY